MRDGKLKDLYNDLCAAMKDLDRAALQPSESAVMNILNYSRTLQTK
jgi:hypothetical protein